MKQVRAHLVDLLGVARDLLVVDARPDEGVELEFMVLGGDAIDEEMIVKVLPDGE